MALSGFPYIHLVETAASIVRNRITKVCAVSQTGLDRGGLSDDLSVFAA